MSFDCQVLDVGNKPESPDQELFERVEDGLVHIDHPATPPADEVVMVALFDVVIDEPAFSKVGLGYQTEFLEKLQRSVYSGTIELRVPGMNLLVEVVNRDMPIGTMQRFKERNSLGSEPVPQILQSLKTAHRHTPISDFPACRLSFLHSRMVIPTKVIIPTTSISRLLNKGRLLL